MLFVEVEYKEEGLTIITKGEAFRLFIFCLVMSFLMGWSRSELSITGIIAIGFIMSVGYILAIVMAGSLKNLFEG